MKKFIQTLTCQIIDLCIYQNELGMTLRKILVVGNIRGNIKKKEVEFYLLL